MREPLPPLNMPLYCTVCRGEIPEKRRMFRNTNTCDKPCAKVLKNWRRRKVEERKCHVCGKPSTPEERAAWNAWRKSRGDKRPGRGRPRKQPAPPAPPVQAAAEEAISALATCGVDEAKA